MKAVKSPYISLSDSVRYRPEYFGGILFDISTGTMMDVDREAYLLIELIKNMGVVNINDLDRIWVKVHNRPHSRRAAIGIIEKLLLIQGDYRSLYSVWEKYSYFVEDDKEDEEDEDEDEEERMISPPIPSERSSGRGIIEQFSNMLE